MFESTQSYYEVLDVKPDATPNEIRQAYLRLKAAYGKGSAALYSVFDEAETRRVLEEVEQAYLVLSSPEKRKEYDQIHGILGPSFVAPGERQHKPAKPMVGSPKTKTDPSNDIAVQTAANLFGESKDVSFGEQPERENDLFSAPSLASREASTAPLDDYSTPRTLASTTSAGPPTQEYNSVPSYESRVGNIRRVELVSASKVAADLERLLGENGIVRGNFLKQARETSGVSLEDLAEFTKISRSYINCIESDAYDSLPAPVYLRGFIVQIAKALKLPHEKVANGYMAAYRSAILK